MALQSYLLFFFNLALLVTMATSSTACRRFETYNVGLIGAIPDAADRRPKIIEGLRSSPADVICLQEVWFEEDMSAILKELSSEYPHHYSAIHDSKDVLNNGHKRLPIFNDKPCDVGETAMLGGSIGFCGWWHGCFSKSGYAMGECISSKCSSHLSNKHIRASCVSCIFMNALNSFFDAIRACSTPKKRHNRFNMPGLLVLGKEDLKTVHYRSFYPDSRPVFERGYIETVLDSVTTVVCTHLSSNVKGYLEYDLDFDNYKDQQTMEITELHDRFGGQHAVILGDINSGPQVTNQGSNPQKNLGGEFLDNYAKWLGYGYVSPYTTLNGLCTYCEDNQYAVASYPNQILDHVMIKTTSHTASEITRRYDDQDISDHYGIGMRLCSVD